MTEAAAPGMAASVGGARPGWVARRRGPTAAASGPAVREVDRTARGIAAAARTAVAVSAGALTLVAAPPSQRPAVAAAVTALALWSAVFLAAAPVRLSPRAAVADTAILVALCLTMRWTVPPWALATGSNWVLVAASITGVAYQWLLGPVAAATGTAAVAAAYLASGGPQVRPLALWILVEAAQAQGLILLVRAGGRRADEALAGEAAMRREAAVAAARRADEREHLAALHDTAAATLLMIAQGMVDGSEPWLTDQAARDLAVLEGGQEPAGIDFRTLLDDVVGRSRLRVRVTSDGTPVLPAGAAVAVCRSVREALTNVERHAGVDTAVVSIRPRQPGVEVEVRDEGGGFDPAVADGRGIAESIVGRMDRAGGSARIHSCAGTGTSVLLTWPRD